MSRLTPSSLYLSLQRHDSISIIYIFSIPTRQTSPVLLPGSSAYLVFLLRSRQLPPKLSAIVIMSVILGNQCQVPFAVGKRRDPISLQLARPSLFHGKRHHPADYPPVGGVVVPCVGLCSPHLTVYSAHRLCTASSQRDPPDSQFQS